MFVRILKLHNNLESCTCTPCKYIKKNLNKKIEVQDLGYGRIKILGITYSSDNIEYKVIPDRFDAYVERMKK